MKRNIFVLLICITFVYAQESIPISSENTPSTIIQNSPRIYKFDEDINIACWTDYRDGVTSYFAQYIKQNGDFFGNNFKVTGNDDFIKLNSENYLNLYITSSPYLDISINSYIAAIYDFSNNLINKFTLSSYFGHWCGTGFIGNYYDLLVKDDYLIWISSHDGWLTRRFFDFEGNIIQEIYEDYDELISNNATLSSAAINENGSYVHVYFSDVHFDYKFQLIIDYYTNDNILSERVYTEFHTEAKIYGYVQNAFNFTKVLVKPDNSFIIIWIDPETNKFYCNEYSPILGWNNETVKEFFLNDRIDFDPFNVINFSFSDFIEDQIYMAFSYYKYVNNQRTYFNGLYLLNEDFTLIEELEVQNDFRQFLGNKLVLNNYGDFFATYTKNNDVYLIALNSFVPYEIGKLNDEETGSNQYNTRINFFEEESFFISWQDEVKYAGVLVDKNNSMISDEIILMNNSIIYLGNGIKLNNYKYGGYNEPKYAGYKILDSDWNIINDIRLDSVDASNRLFVDYEFIGNDLYVVTLSQDSLKLFGIDDNGEISTSNKQAFQNNYYYMKLWSLTDSSFLLHLSDSAAVYNTNFELLSGNYPVPYGAKFIMDSDKIVSIYSNYTPFGSYKTEFSIYSFEGDLVYLHEEPIGWNAYETSMKINEKEFIIIYKKNKRFYGKVFDVNGTLKKSEFLLSPDTDSSKKDFIISQGKNKVRLAWAEARTPGNGYDIFTSIIDRSIITSVEQIYSETIINNYYLSQNYPNPFNPSTKIEFVIPSSEKVNITIYNILGEKVLTVVDEYLQAGNYSINIDLSDYSSGVYFYMLSANNSGQVLNKKMLLLK